MSRLSSSRPATLAPPGRRAPGSWSPRWVTFGVPAVLAAAYVLLFALRLGAILQAVYSSGDAASGPMIGELFDAAPKGATVILGNLPWYTTLWFELATRSLPFHRQLWEVGPWLVSLTGIGLVAWATAKAAGRWAGALVLFVLACAGPGLLPYVAAPLQHGPTLAQACLLDAFLVVLARRSGMIGGRLTHLLVCAAIAALTAVGAASDKLLFISGVIPFVLAGLLVGFLVPRDAGRRIALTAAGIGVSAAIGAPIVVWAMEARHIRQAAFPISLATWDRLGPNVQIVAESLAFLFNGDFGGDALGPRAVLTLACAVFAVTALIVAARAGRAWTSELAHRLESRKRDEHPLFAARAVHMSFWLLAGAFTGTSLLLTSLPKDRFSARYLLPSAVAIVVLTAVALADRTRRQRGLAWLGACVIVLGSLVSFAKRDFAAGTGGYPTNQAAAAILSAVRAEGLKLGYAGYWDAAALTWESHERMLVYPVERCRGGARLCDVGLHEISSWYTPRPATRTFLLIDSVNSLRPWPARPAPTLGPASKVIALGRYTLYVYDHDIARDITFTGSRNQGS